MEESKLELIPRQKIENVVCANVEIAEVEEMLELAKRMIQFCAETGGIGLAAPQIGVFKKLIVWNTKENIFQVGFNPIYFLKEKKTTHTIEACLSYPGEKYYLERYKYIKTVYEVPSKDKTELVKIYKAVRDEEAIVFQHEADHVYGKTIATKGKMVYKE